MFQMRNRKACWLVRNLRPGDYLPTYLPELGSYLPKLGSYPTVILGGLMGVSAIFTLRVLRTFSLANYISSLRCTH